MTIDYTQPPPPGPPPPQQRSWWSRYWMWVVALGCLLPILVIGGCVAGIAYFAMSTIRATDVYTDAVERAKSDPRVVEALGAPVETRWWVTGEFNVDGEEDSADFDVPLQGSQNKGTLEVEGTRDRGDWSYSVMRVHVEGGRVIDLIPADAPSTEESPDTTPPGD
ncbi:MAG TPA: cytochrome c oxidase assembly factor Coa1 family protein [Thermoanaerobaculia bacterium]|nr:cytochrome c oxidase assembly factor Coa1 family protein [Thermoanaerobaculia bacterium]